MESIIIIGGGIAGVSAAEAIRANNKKCCITILGDEDYLPYYRMRLSHEIGKNPRVSNLLIHESDWYVQNNIVFKNKSKVVEIDAKKHLVVLNNEKLHFDKLLIANGSSPFVPPVEGVHHQGVFALRTVNDLKKLYNFVENKETGTVIGGGVLGLEAAWGLASRAGKEIVLLERGPYLLSKQLDKKGSDMLKARGEAAGITFFTQCNVNKIDGTEKVEGIHLETQGCISTQFVIFATGIRPNINIFKKSSLDVGRGVVVNEFMETSIDGVYAAGDVAEYREKVYGIWPVAREQGRTAGLNMAGIKKRYEEVVPSNYISVFDTKVFSAGQIHDNDKQNCIVIEDYRPKEGIYRKLVIEDGVIIGVILVGNTKKALDFQKAIKNKLPIDKTLINKNSFKEIVKILYRRKEK